MWRDCVSNKSVLICSAYLPLMSLSFCKLHSLSNEQRRVIITGGICTGNYSVPGFRCGETVLVICLYSSVLLICGCCPSVVCCSCVSARFTLSLSLSTTYLPLSFFLSLSLPVYTYLSFFISFCKFIHVCTSVCFCLLAWLQRFLRLSVVLFLGPAIIRVFSDGVPMFMVEVTSDIK